MLYFDGGNEVDFRLDPQRKKEWIEALRSGKYEQDIKNLRTEIGFCCLGVLCDVIDSSRWQSFNYKYTWLDDKRVYEETISFEEMPECIQFQLIQMNDSGYSFAHIANWIEENL